MSNNLHLVTGYAGEEHVTSADMGSYNAAMIGNGEYVLERGNKFAASIISNNKVKVLDGDLMMQGRHVRLNENTYVELDFENGTQGYKRNDLIVARYTKDSTTGVESCNLVVIKGTPSTSTASDPAYTTGDIIKNHVSVNDMPLYRVPFDGLNMQSLVKLFSVSPTLKELKENAANEFKKYIEDKKEEIDDNIIDTLNGIKTNTELNKIAGALAVKEFFESINIDIANIKKSVSDGKVLVADAITAKGVETATDATFETMANNINLISSLKLTGFTNVNWGASSPPYTITGVTRGKKYLLVYFENNDGSTFHDFEISNAKVLQEFSNTDSNMRLGMCIVEATATTMPFSHNALVLSYKEL